MMNYDPILSLENEKAKIETGFWEVNEKGESYKDQALKKVGQGIADGWEEAVGKTA